MRFDRFAIVPVVAAALVLGACETDEPVEEDIPAAEVPAVEPVGEVGFTQWDRDADTRLAADEWNAWWGERNVYETWGGGDAIDEDEFATNVFAVWDEDDDARLTEAEWNEEAEGWFGAEAGAFDDWDLNDDTFLDENEFRTGLGERDLFGDWDLNDNEMLEENEFGEGVFGLWDENDDTFIETGEWEEGARGWGL